MDHVHCIATWLCVTNVVYRECKQRDVYHGGDLEEIVSLIVAILLLLKRVGKPQVCLNKTCCRKRLCCLIVPAHILAETELHLQCRRCRKENSSLCIVLAFILGKNGGGE
jgi:hypothetical protein